MAAEVSSKAHALSVEEVLAGVESGPEGLTDEEAAARLERYGPNVLQAAAPVSAWKILLDQLRSVVVLLLLAAAVVALLTGDPVDSAAIGAVLVINTVIGFATEIRARREMEALLRLEAPSAVVVRRGRSHEIDASEVVPGDVIRVEAGQSIAADARVLRSSELRVDEAALTGESVPVDKKSDPVAEDAPLPDRADMLYKGTTAVAGAGRAVVVSTGMRTELGRIGGLVGAIAEEKTPLEKRLDILGRRLVWLSLLVAALVIGIGVLQGVPVGRMVEAGIALAIAAVPEGLPAVATIALAVGVRRMARRQALVRRLPSVETLGSVTVTCADKTGTLTAGEMTVTTLWVPGAEFEVTGTGYAPEGEIRAEGRGVRPADDPRLSAALRIAALANRADVRQKEGRWAPRGDPTEAALVVAARKAGLEPAALREEWPEEGEVPFSSERMWMATFHRAPGGELVAHVKGAPDRIVACCARVLEESGEEELDDAGRDALLERNDRLAARGLRVLALACARADAPEARAVERLTFVGFVGMIDPPAEGVLETVRTLREAGIRTVMITGDQQRTAEAVARELGILGAGEEVLGGTEFERLSPEDLVERVARVRAFSRISPEDKLRIVTAYQGEGEIVAMLGDGVNDAAALKKADVGVAMGRRGTDVAKESADVVLRDDRFRTIGAAVEEGRVIYDNILKFVFYLFSCNLAEVMVLLGAGVAGFPLPLTPLQILWLNLVTDTFPALALALEPAEPDVMRRPSRDPDEAILSAAFMRSVAAYAVLITAAAFAAFVYGLEGDAATRRATTLTFMTLALAQLFHLGNARSTGHVMSLGRALANPYAVGALGLVGALQLAAVYLPPLAGVLETVPVSARDWLVVLPLALSPALAGQLYKLARSRP